MLLQRFRSQSLMPSFVAPADMTVTENTDLWQAPAIQPKHPAGFEVSQQVLPRPACKAGSFHPIEPPFMPLIRQV